MIRHWRRHRQRRLKVERSASRDRQQALKRRSGAQRLRHQFIVIAAVQEVKTDQEVEGFAVQRTEGEHVRRQFQRQTVLFEGGVERGRVDLAAAYSPRFETHPAIARLVFVLFEHEVPIVAHVEVPHRGIRLLHPAEEFQHRLPLRRKLHLRVEIQIHEEIVRQ
jgi:hypothetical protein